MRTHTCMVLDLILFLHARTYIVTILKVDENFTNLTIKRYSSISLSDVGLICVSDIRSEGTSPSGFTITEDRHAIVNKNLYDTTKDLLYLSLYYPRSF